MADLEDLNYKKILNMDNDDAIETLRLIRLSRRVPVKKRSSTKKKKTEPVIDANMAATLLKILGGENE